MGENPLLLDTLCEVVHGRLGDMDPSLVLRTLSSLSRLVHCPSDSVLQAIWEQCLHYRASYTQREFTRLVALFNSFGHERGEGAPETPSSCYRGRPRAQRRHLNRPDSHPVP